MPKNQNGSTFVNVIFVLLIFGLIGFGVYKYYLPTFLPRALPQSYDECTKTPGSLLQESYPTVCISRFGGRFTEVLSEEDQNKLDAVLSEANSKKYVDPDYGFSFMFPLGFDFALGKEFIPPYFLDTPSVVIKKTGFQDSTAQYVESADFSVSSSKDIKNCYKFGSNTISDTQTINGVIFKTAKTSEGATGHVIDATLYRTIRGKICFELVTAIQSETGSGEGIGLLQKTILADQQKLHSELDKIVSTFTFN